MNIGWVDGGEKYGILLYNSWPLRGTSSKDRLIGI